MPLPPPLGKNLKFLKLEYIWTAANTRREMIKKGKSVFVTKLQLWRGLPDCLRDSWTPKLKNPESGNNSVAMVYHEASNK